jgi:hypothetical protein
VVQPAEHSFGNDLSASFPRQRHLPRRLELSIQTSGAVATDNNR